MLTEQKQITLCSQSSNQSICSLVRALAYGVTIGRVFKNATLRTHQPELDVARATCVDVYALECLRTRVRQKVAHGVTEID